MPTNVPPPAVNLGWTWRRGGPGRSQLRGYRLGSVTRQGVVAENHLLAPGETKTASTRIMVAGMDSLWLWSDRPALVSRTVASGTDEVQRIILGGGTVPTSGTFAVRYAAGNTGAIPYNATAGQVQAAYEAASWIGPGDVSVAGGPFPADLVVTFTGALAGTDIASPTPPHIYSFDWSGSPVLVGTDTNGGGGGATTADTITLLGMAHPFAWHAAYTDHLPLPWGGDVEGLTLENPSASMNALIKIRAYYDLEV